MILEYTLYIAMVIATWFMQEYVQDNHLDYVCASDERTGDRLYEDTPIVLLPPCADVHRR